MRLLELFCGNKCVGKVFEKNKWEVISLDINGKFNASITKDICDWDYAEYDKSHFDFIWASPDCTTFSLACSGRHRTIADIDGKTEKALNGNEMIKSLVKVLQYFDCEWIVENPRGLLRTYLPLKMVIPFRTTVYYSNYDWLIHKPTDLFSSIHLWESEKQPNKEVVKYRDWKCKSAEKRSFIPEKLIDKIYEKIV